MIVPIKKDPNGLQEWAIIELQGDLNLTSSNADKYIGDLHFTTNKTPVLIIGVHILHGKEMPLDKPFAVLQKSSVTTENPNDRTQEVYFSLKGVVKNKIIFKGRPKPFILNQPHL